MLAQMDISLCSAELNDLMAIHKEMVHITESANIKKNYDFNLIFCLLCLITIRYIPIQSHPSRWISIYEMKKEK